MIYLTSQFPFWVFERCLFLIWLLIFLVFYIYFKRRKSFADRIWVKRKNALFDSKSFKWNVEILKLLLIFILPCVCVCVYTHWPWRLHLSVKVGMPGSRSTMLCWRRFFILPSPFIATLELATLSCLHTRCRQSQCLAGVRLDFKS